MLEMQTGYVRHSIEQHIILFRIHAESPMDRSIQQLISLFQVDSPYKLQLWRQMVSR